jgi:hypothetical protein
MNQPAEGAGMTTISWSVSALECVAKNGKDNVVSTVHWRCEGGANSASIYGSIAVPYEDGPFTQYADLTEEIVIGWVHNCMGAEQVARYEDAVRAELAALANPPVAKPPLPWA